MSALSTDTCCRVARSQRCMSEQLVLLSALCALEAVPLKFNYFAAFWRDVANTPADAKLEEMLLECSVVTEYVDAVLLDERDSLEDPAIYEFMQHYYPKLCALASSSDAPESPSGSGGGGGATSGAGAVCAAVALAEELAAAAARAPLGALLGRARALALLAPHALAHAHEPPLALQHAAQALQQRLLRAAEEENSEPETGAGASEPARCPSRDGSDAEADAEGDVDGDEAGSEAAADADESAEEEPAPRGGLLARLTLAVHALAAATATAATAAPDLCDAQP
ncbi:unnamed protein product [Parnassius apollo]|uniref:(apollo) hypothetical protein n=1 Tax=Parnassius apollo TaxID=110799 RepID=A0A8S3W006_PARAO|nr:unnamed protein product [Parnassius apollo]